MSGSPWWWGQSSGLFMERKMLSKVALTTVPNQERFSLPRDTWQCWRYLQLSQRGVWTLLASSGQMRGMLLNPTGPNMAP